MLILIFPLNYLNGRIDEFENADLNDYWIEFGENIWKNSKLISSLFHFQLFCPLPVNQNLLFWPGSSFNTLRIQVQALAFCTVRLLGFQFMMARLLRWRIFRLEPQFLGLVREILQEERRNWVTCVTVKVAVAVAVCERRLGMRMMVEFPWGSWTPELV